MTNSEVRAFVGHLKEVAANGDELEDLPDMESLVSGVLYRNSLAWLVGPSGHGKTFLGIDIAGCVANGMPWYGRETQQGKVVYVIAEHGKLRSRVDAWKSANGNASMRNVTFLPMAVLLTDSIQRDGFVTYLKTLKPALLVLDTQSRMTLGVEENSAKEMGQVIAVLDEIRQATGACVLTVHHPDKANTGMRGSNTTLGAAQTVLQVVKKGTHMTVSFQKQKDGDDQTNFSFELVPSKESMVTRVSEPLTPEGGGANETRSRARGSSSPAEKFVRANPGCTWQEVTAATGCSRATAYRVLKEVKSHAPPTEAQEAAMPPEPSVPRSALPRSRNGKVSLRAVHSKTTDRAKPAKRVRGPRRAEKPAEDQLTPDPSPTKGRSLKRREKPSQRATDTSEPVDEMAEYLQAQKSRPKKYVHPGEKLFGNRYAGSSRF